MDIPWQLCRTIGPLTLHSQEMTGFRLVLYLDHRHPVPIRTDSTGWI